VKSKTAAALKGFPLSGAFAMACHAKSGLAQSMARELMPQGIHIANVPIDAAIGWRQDDGTRAHSLAGVAVDDNMADPDYIAETYLQLRRQHRSTWAFEVVLRPWVEKWRLALARDRHRDPSAGRSHTDLVRGVLVPRPFGQAVIDVDDALSIEDVASRPERFRDLALRAEFEQCQEREPHAAALFGDRRAAKRAAHLARRHAPGPVEHAGIRRKRG
jgi:hypothetical protein